MLLKILVVDDSAPDRLIIENMLYDHSILTAGDGIEAMRLLEAHPDINLLILDLNMPNMDGFAVLEALKSDRRYQKIRTIILTNYDEIDNEIKGLKLGAVDYIRKPIHLHSLRARIEMHAELLRIQHTLEQKLYKQRLTFDTILDQAPIGIAVTYNKDPLDDARNAPSIFNAMFERITGRSKQELIELGWERITHPDDVAEDVNQFRRLQQGEIQSYSMDKRYVKPDGSVVWVHMVVAPLILSNGQKDDHICLIQDISGRKAMEDNLRFITEHDLLTGLHNRDYLNALLEQDAKKGVPTKRALVGINLSTLHLLTVNYGFNYTQNLMIKVATTLSQFCTCHCLLFRTHENRFVFYLKHYQDKQALLDFSESVASALDALLVADRVGGGIGILEIEPQESDVDLLARKLMIASEKSVNLYDKEFKVCYYDEALEANVNRESVIRNELAKLSADHTHGSLFLQYQPILDLRTNAISGFEALARLRSEQLGLVSPNEFIPIAEETKLIIPIGEKVFLEAFRFLRQLAALGYHAITVSVNVSGIQLLRPDFANRLLELIKENRVNPKNICIEITESIFAYDYAHINTIISRLKHEGIDVAIDDFGTGYSSLAREKELNINCLKIDKYFIDRILEAGYDKAITGDIISIAHKLGHSTIAEGVENEEQLQYLIDHGCDKIQGFILSEPQDAEAAIELLNSHPKEIIGCRQADGKLTAKDRTDELQKAVVTLEEHKEQLQLILDSAAEAIYGIDVYGNCTFCNKSCVAMLGYNNPSELLGKNMHWQIHHSRKDGSPLPMEECRILSACRQGQGARVDDEVFWRSDGTCFDVEYYSYPQVKNGAVVGAVITFMDISDQKLREAEIQHLIYHDFLTGLYNRRYFQENVAKVDIPENLPLSVIFADINALKIMNDVFGHATGDELIKQAADILRRVCRPKDLVTRNGGDEFIILLPNTPKEDAEKIIAEIKSGFADSHIESIKCSVSLGLDTKQTPDQLLGVIMVNAENAMYREKIMNRKSVNTDVIETIIETLHAKDPQGRQHSIAVSKLCADVGAAMQLPEAEINKLERAGYLHDIGKISLDTDLLSKEYLSDEETEKMMQHSVVGYRILNLFDDTLDLADVVYGHHELWNGTGYPRGLKGEQIPLLSRIIKIAEAYDRVLNYGELPLEQRTLAALQFVKDGAGTLFDPNIADQFVRMLSSP